MHTLAAALSLFVFSAHAAIIQGTIRDASGAAIPFAQVSAVNRLGVVAQANTNDAGAFTLNVADSAGARLLITAAGFATRTAALEEGVITLEIAPQTDSVRVTGSALDVSASEQGASIDIVSQREIRERNEPLAADLLRYLPGVTLTQPGGRGAVTGAFLRGGNYNFGLVQIDGVAVNSFGGAFDFAHIPSDWLDRVEVVRGPQSAVYGPYANSGVINFVSRSAATAPPLDLLAEGGTYQERRFAAGAALLARGFGIAAFASRLDAGGPVANSDYRNENLALHLTRSFTRQFLSLTGNFNSNEVGAPGPYGSNPAGNFGGLDLVSRNFNNTSVYSARYQADITPRLRQELSGGFFLNNSGFQSPFPFAFNKDLRGSGESRTIVSVNRWYNIAAGVAFAREEVKNAYINDNAFSPFQLPRNDTGAYWENRFHTRHFFANAGLRADWIRTGSVPGNAAFGRPDFPAQTFARVNPKLSAAYVARGFRLHGSFSTGMRPASGLEMAFTNNPALKPERTTSFEAGAEQRLFDNRLALGATWFYNRFYDLIVSLGGTLARLSQYQSDNLANSRARGVEFSARLRPARTLLVNANYTYLDSEILSLSGASRVAPRFFEVGQQLLRRPRHSGGLVAAFHYKRVSANATLYTRSSVLDVEPNFGALSGIYRAAGYAVAGLSLNLALGHGVTAYGTLRNALNRRYEDVFGFPSPLLNFTAGLKWRLSRENRP